MPNMNESGNQPRSLAEYIQSNPQQIIAHDAATGQGVVLSARVTEQAPITEDTAGVQPTGNVDEGQGTGEPTTQAAPAEVVPNPEMEALNSRLQRAEAAIQERDNQLKLINDAIAKREHQQFVQSLEGLSDEDKERALLRRQNQQLQNERNAAVTQLQTVQTQSVEQQEAASKKQVAHILAYNSGLPPAYVNLLMSAQNVDEMKAHAAFLGKEFGQKTASQKQEAINELANSQALRPTGDNAGAFVPEGPKKRSGDIRGLIASRSYQVAEHI